MKSISASIVIVAGVATVVASCFIQHSDEQGLTAVLGVVVTVCGFVGWTRTIFIDK
jgi:VIT1/CCC1 family predicted Fe2+/Mn2+ transporter